MKGTLKSVVNDGELRSTILYSYRCLHCDYTTAPYLSVDDAIKAWDNYDAIENPSWFKEGAVIWCPEWECFCYVQKVLKKSSHVTRLSGSFRTHDFPNEIINASFISIEEYIAKNKYCNADIPIHGRTGVYRL
jgi:hypothetical protein